MNDDMYEGEGWKRRIGGQWACGYRNIEHDGECCVHGTNRTSLQLCMDIDMWRECI